MKKTDKKIISIFLVLIILISQVIPLMVNAVEKPVYNTLTEYIEKNESAIYYNEYKQANILTIDDVKIKDISDISDYNNIDEIHINYSNIGNGTKVILPSTIKDFGIGFESSFEGTLSFEDTKDVSINVYVDEMGDLSKGIIDLRGVENVYIEYFVEGTKSSEYKLEERILLDDYSDVIVNIYEGRTEFIYESNNNTDEVEIPKVTLEEYLIKNGVDENEDGKINDDEWKSVKNLDLQEEIISDLKGLEKATNLKKLSLRNIDLNLIDFSKLTNLEDFHSYEYNDDISEDKIEKIEFPKMPKIKSISIQTNKIKNLDISKLENLENLYFYGFQTNVKFPNLDNVDNIHLYIGNIDVDLANNKEGYIWIYAPEWQYIKFPENRIIEHNGYTVKTCHHTENEIIHINKNEIYEFYVDDITLKNTDIIEINEIQKTDYSPVAFEILGKEVGETEIEIIDAIGKKHTIKVVVEEKIIEENKNIDKSLDNSGITAEFCEYTNKILKSNGELWEINSEEATGTIIDKDVKKYVSNIVYYTEYFNAFGIFENTLYNNNTLKISFNEFGNYYMGNGKNSTKEIKDVIDMDNNLYLKSNGDLYVIRYSYITEEFLNDEFITSGVKKILGNFIVKDDNTLWFDENESKHDAVDYKKEYKKVENHEIKYDIYYWKEERDTYGNWIETVFCEAFVDSNNSLWIYYKNEWIKEIENFDKNYGKNYINGFYLMLEDEKVYKFYYEEDGWKLIKGELVLDNVVSLEWGDIIIRTDGSIWTYTEEKGLNKIIKSTPGVEPEEKPEEKEEYIKNENIKEKEICKKTTISGLKVKQTVEDFLKENNFKEGYTVKVFNSDNKEVASAEFLGTGTKVKLYKNGKVVKEYTVLIYGDTDGDGKIDSFDALTLIKLINEKIELKDPVYLEAGKVSGEEKASAVDALTIVKSLNGKAEISQSI